MLRVDTPFRLWTCPPGMPADRPGGDHESALASATPDRKVLCRNCRRSGGTSTTAADSGGTRE